jgi:hypothetical protein
MHYLPARCDACSFVVLVPQLVHGTVLSPCAKCGAEVTIFPGAKHQASERTLFAELSESVHATVSPGNATACLSDIENLARDAPALILSLVIARACLDEAGFQRQFFHVDGQRGGHASDHAASTFVNAQSLRIRRLLRSDRASHRKRGACVNSPIVVYELSKSEAARSNFT